MKIDQSKRVTAAIYDQYMHAFDLDKVLRLGGVDSKIVSKCAVQVHPDQVELAREVLRAEEAKRKLTPWPVATEEEDASA